MSSFNLFCRPMRRWALVVALLGLTGAAVQAQPTDSIVVVAKHHAEVPRLSVEQVSGIFMGQIDMLPNGTVVTPVDAPESTALYQDFYRKVTGKSAAQIKAYRARQAFTGVGIPPRQAATLAQAFNRGSKESAVITYIWKRELNDQLQVVLDAGK